MRTQEDRQMLAQMLLAEWCLDQSEGAPNQDQVARDIARSKAAASQLKLILGGLAMQDLGSALTDAVEPIVARINAAIAAMTRH